ncbi:MAG TPA: PspC domain-containing protein [Kribbella sp.]|uniref:PspC domain-containing protein n=1 Tax=Kribbella sp. TaxID=1871183 RepID=UPI002D77D59E|nr:PspC domain-containing protein [Kribbella sp.]HET6298229.1 PspC domain-containing protein [Kribbella sp.]
MEQNPNDPGPAGGFDASRLKDVQSWRRSRSDRMVAGVCGGIGRALNIDPVLVRVVMGVLALMGPGLLFYAAAWVLMPDEGSDRSAAEGLLGGRVKPDHPWVWPVVIGICVFAAIAMMSSFDFGRLVPGPLIVLGLIWLFVFRRKGRGSRRFRRHNATNWSGQGTNWTGTPPNWSGQPGSTNQTGAAPAAQYQPTAPNPTQTGPSAPPTGPSSSATQRPQDRTVEPVQPVWTEDDPLGLYVDEPATGAPAKRPAAPPVKGYRGVKSAVVALTGIAIAIAWLAGAPTSLMLVIGLATLGLGMLFGGFLGRTLALLPLGILLAVGIAVSTVFPTFPREFTDTNIVATAADKPITTSNYTFDGGALHLDLTKATFAPGAKIVVDGGLGEVVIKVPQNVDVNATLTAQLGEVIGLDQRNSGPDAKVSLTNNLGADAKAGPQSVTLDVGLKLGSIRVERG